VEHALALDAAGMLMAWGDDSAGQLGVSLLAGFSAVPQVVNLAQP
jgi:alpha-tubulin suppressor-like RCC1 family protein